MRVDAIKNACLASAAVVRRSMHGHNEQLNQIADVIAKGAEASLSASKLGATS